MDWTVRNMLNQALRNMVVVFLGHVLLLRSLHCLPFFSRISWSWSLFCSLLFCVLNELNLCRPPQEEKIEHSNELNDLSFSSGLKHQNNTKNLGDDCCKEIQDLGKQFPSASCNENVSSNYEFLRYTTCESKCLIKGVIGMLKSLIKTILNHLCEGVASSLGLKLL